MADELPLFLPTPTFRWFIQKYTPDELIEADPQLKPSDRQDVIDLLRDNPKHALGEPELQQLWRNPKTNDCRWKAIPTVVGSTQPIEGST